jgi:uncharacterized protein (DUF2147 family)
MKIGSVLSVLLLASYSIAQTCVGTWITIDDATGKKKSKVELYKQDGKLFGKITYVYPRPGLEENAVCKKCPGDRKNKPLVGLQIVRGLTWNGSEWEDGTIVDPENGKVYTCSIWLEEGNPDKLNVRGYVGPFFRTQTWLRVKE